MTALYAAVKFAAYSGWCYVGLKTLRPGEPAHWKSALGLGFLRLAMGLFFGAAIWLLGNLAAIALHNQQVLVYLVVYVPVRWIEWAIMDRLIAHTWTGFLLGPDSTTRGWRARGIVLSCLADIPIIVSMGGLPLGRFMC